MNEERKRVEHPSWCDRNDCTAPEFRPTSEEYQGGAAGSHYSATLGSRTNDLQIFLAQSVCPWETEVYLVVRNGEDGVPQTVPMSDTGGGFALYALLGQEIKDVVRKYPALYAERFPYVQRAIEDEADEATADASAPRDPVELEEQMVAESVADEKEELALFAESLRLDVNGTTKVRGTFQEIQAAVVDVVTTRLALAPEHLAPEAQAIRGAFAEGDVQAALDDRGQWYMVMDGHSDNPLRIKVEKEG